MKVSKLRARIILTDTLDMLSPDPGVRDRFMEAVERQQCIVHPLNVPVWGPLETQRMLLTGRSASKSRRSGGRLCWMASG